MAAGPSAIDAQDVETSTRIAHTMKGASLNVSSPILSKVAKELESVSKESNFVSAKMHATTFLIHFERFNEAVLRMNNPVSP